MYHLGKQSASPMYRSDGMRLLESINSSIAVLEIAKELDIKMVSASTSFLYINLEPQHSEEMHLQPTDFYTEARFFEERNAKVYGNLYNVKWNEMHFFSIYGPREQNKKNYANLVTQFLWALNKNEVPIIYCDGSQSRDFISAEETAKASSLAMEHRKNEETYNIGTGTSTDFNTIFQIIKEEMNYKKEAVYVTNPLKHYQRFTQADLAKTKKDLDFIQNMI
ncbi:MAG: NAD-dependent epimerase/dehydratase family protein [Thermoplasmata archaeon]